MSDNPLFRDKNYLRAVLRQSILDLTVRDTVLRDAVANAHFADAILALMDRCDALEAKLEGKP